MTYDNDTTTAGVQDGAGTGWNATATNTDFYNGTSDVAWPNTTGDVAVFGGGTSGSGASVTVGTVNANGIVFNTPFTAASAYTLNSGTITLGGTNAFITSNDTASGQSNRVNSNIALSSTVTINVAGVSGLILQGTGAGTSGTGTGLIVASTGTGVLDTRGANTFDGGLAINSGNVTAQVSNTALGAGTVTLGAASGSASAYLRIGGGAFTAASNAVTVQAGNTGTMTIGTNGTNSGTLSGTVTVNNALTLSSNGNAATAATLTLSGAANGVSLAGAGALTITTPTPAQTANSVSIGGTNTNFSGNVTVAAGLLTITSNSALGTGNMTVSNGATLTLNAGVTAAHSANATSLTIGSTGVVNLLATTAGTVQDTVSMLSIGGATETMMGTYGSTASGAMYTFSEFTGNGVIQFTPTAVPEPGTWVAVLGGIGALALARRRCVRA